MNENQELDILGATVTERISERTKSVIHFLLFSITYLDDNKW
jgi:hypothetical protein